MFAATYFGANGWLLEIGGLRLLVDPWLTGPLVFPPGPWLLRGELPRPWPVPDRLDLLLLTQGLADHCHPASLALLDRQLPVVASPAAAARARQLGFSEVTALKPGERLAWPDQGQTLEIRATAGAPVPQVENGYLLHHPAGRLYLEPHGFCDPCLAPEPLDAVITPVVDLGLPLLGAFVKGREVLPQLLERFRPRTVLASTAGGDVRFSALPCCPCCGSRAAPSRPGSGLPRSPAVAPPRYHRAWLIPGQASGMTCFKPEPPPMLDAPFGRRRFLTLAGAAGLALGAGSRLWPPGEAASAAPPAGRSALPDLPPRGDRRLVAISDLNGPYGSTAYLPQVHRAVALIPALAPDLVLCGGDMVAGQKAGLSPAQLAAMWAAFEQQLLLPLRRAGLPVAFTLGNHDASGSRAGGRYTFAEDRKAAERFWRPRQDQLGLRFVDASRFPFAYSVRQADLFLLVWDASAPLLPAEQIAWAERSLASEAARSAQARLVLGHLPLQAIARGRENPGEVLQQADVLQRLLERGGASAYISGHHHAFFPGRSGQLDLLALGALGHGPRRLLGSGQSPRHTLTLIDLFWPRDGRPGRRTYTSYDMTSLQRIRPAELPAQITTPGGRRLERLG